MLISVILPCYNALSYLPIAVTSVLSQSHKDIELLIIDDCSTDGTKDYLDALSPTDDRVRVFSSQVNLGAAMSRNIGLDYAKGAFVAFIDSDDSWKGDKLALQLEFMLVNNATVSHTSYSFINSLGSRIRGGYRARENLDLKEYLKTTGIGLSTSMLRFERLPDRRFPIDRYREDFLFWLQLLSDGHISFALENDLSSYRVRDGQVSENKIKMMSEMFSIYISIESVPLVKRLYYFISYVINATLKRL